MSSASYYRRKITEYESLRSKAYKKIDANEAILKKLNDVRPLVESLEEYLRNAEDNFQKGGYLYNNETLSQGKLLEDAEKVATGLAAINDSISKLNSEIVAFRADIRTYNRNISWYKQKYNAANKEETK